MGSFTIHSIPENLDKKLAERAKLARTSKNQLIKNLLAQGTGLPSTGALEDDYREFCGIWSKAELNEFNRTQDGNQAIDAADWQG
jgi:hypothetical protein